MKQFCSNKFTGRNVKNAIILITLFALCSTLSNAQHGISPGYSFLDAKNKQVNITIFNQGDEEKEAEIQLKFGYPCYEDSLGNTKMKYNDSLLACIYGLDKRVKVFPKKVIIAPKSQQYVKLMLTGNTDDIPDGTLWTRISVKTLMKKKQIDTTKTDGIKVGVDIIYETTTNLMFQKGKLTTGIEVGNMERKEDSLNYYFVFDTKKIGNSPYLGMYELKIKGNDGSEIEPFLGSYNIYFDGKPGIRVPKNNLKNGEYTASLKIHNHREDIDEDRAIKTEPIIKNFNFKID